MQPSILEFEECGARKVQLLDQETQTSKAKLIIDSKSSIKVTKSSSKQTLDSSNKGSITLFEYCQIVQDSANPESVAIIKESISEEIQKHSKNPLSIGVAERYKYSKEVIKPYIQSHSSDSQPSKEELIKEVLESVHQDFPDYQPCIDNYNNESITDSTQSSVSKVSAVTSFDSKPSKVKMEKGEEVTNEYGSKIKQRPGCFPSDVDTPSGIPDPGCDVKPTGSVKNVKSVSSAKSVTSAKTSCPPKKKQPPKMCDPTCEAECAIGRRVEKKKEKSPSRTSEGECLPSIDYCIRSKESKAPSDESIGNKGKKSSAEVFGITKPVPPEKKASVTMKKTNVPVPAKPEKRYIPKTDSPTSVVPPTKSVVEDFITRIYSKTNETFSMIRMGNVRDSNNSISPCDEEGNNNKGDQSSKEFSFFRKVDSLSKDEESNQSCEYKAPETTLEDFIDNVDSTTSNINDIDFDDFKPEPRNLNEPGSPCKELKPPQNVANLIVQTNVGAPRIPVPQLNSVFTTIKTKICSLFGDEKKAGEGNSNDCSQFDEDEDADIMERLIE